MRSSMKITVARLVLLMASTGYAVAGDRSITPLQGFTVNPQVAVLAIRERPASQSGYSRVEHSHWHFVGCADSHDHCHHIAEHAGYHHATVRHDHDQCHHHPHLACYAWN